MTDSIVWQFATEHDFSAFLIHLGTRSTWSHVDAVLPDGTLLGARSDGGVQIRQPGYAQFTKTQICKIRSPLADQFYKTLETQIGKPYDWRAIFAFGFGDHDWRETGSWFCSELQIWAMETVGFFSHPILIDYARLSPRDQLLLFSPWIELHENDTTMIL